MPTKALSITESLHAEIERVPEARRALLLGLVHSFRKGIEQEIEDIDHRNSIRELKADKTQPIEKLWFEEAARRAAEMDQGITQRIPAEVVLREAQALLK